MTDYRFIQVERRDAVARVVLNRPELRNAFNPAMIAELTGVFASFETDDDIRTVILSGAGPSFCAGADLTWMREMASYTHDENVADARRLAAMLDAVAGCPVPVIARVQGAALGGGAGLVAACDVAVCAADAVFGFTEARLGLAPAVIAPFVIRKIGAGQAGALFVTSERFDAARAERIGLVHRVAEAAHLDVVVDDAVANVLAGGPRAVRACKHLAAAIPAMSDNEARAFTAETIAALRASDEGQEGMRAFLEKRRPCFAKS